MTSDQRIRQRYPYVADLPERSPGGKPDVARMHKWLCERFGGPQDGRWYIRGLRVYFAHKVDFAAFAEAWGTESG